MNNQAIESSGATVTGNTPTTECLDIPVEKNIQTEAVDIFSEIRIGNYKPTPIAKCNLKELRTRLSVRFSDGSNNKTSATIRLGGRVSLLIGGKKSVVIERDSHTEEEILQMVLKSPEAVLDDLLIDAKNRYIASTKKSKRTRKSAVRLKLAKESRETKRDTSTTAYLTSKLALEEAQQAINDAGL